MQDLWEGERPIDDDLLAQLLEDKEQPSLLIPEIPFYQATPNISSSQETGRTFLTDTTFISNVGKYHLEYFLTTNMVANNLAFTQRGNTFAVMVVYYFHLIVIQKVYDVNDWYNQWNIQKNKDVS